MIYRCRLCSNGAGADTPEDFVAHMRYLHGVTITVEDCEELLRRQGAARRFKIARRREDGEWRLARGAPYKTRDAAERALAQRDPATYKIVEIVRGARTPAPPETADTRAREQKPSRRDEGKQAP